MIKKIKNTVPWTYVISDLNGEEFVGTFYEKELQKANENENEIKRKGDKLYVEWRGYENSLTIRLIKVILLYKNELFSTI